MKTKLGLVLSALTVFAVGAWAYANSVTYSGQGLIADGFGGYDLITETCGVANGAEVDGPYLLWVLTATGATNANISFYGAPPVAMSKFGGGTLKYVSGWYDPSTLPGNVVATYDGKVKNAQLTISHGCRPLDRGKPTWCSPGFWAHADTAAWNLLIPATLKTDPFNGNVSTAYYGADLSAAPDLITVLTNAPLYSGASNQGTVLTCPLNAFNATGAFLTDRIPGYQFSCAALAATTDQSDTCPIDSHGNFKQ